MAVPPCRPGRRTDTAAENRYGGAGQQNRGDGAMRATTNTRGTMSRKARAGAILVALALAPLLGGCDKCGDWFGISRGQAHGGLESCREAPTPQR